MWRLPFDLYPLWILMFIDENYVKSADFEPRCCSELTIITFGAGAAEQEIRKK
jgi:hypothetical protein